MTAWQQFFDGLRWTYPWWVMGASVVILAAGACMATWKLALWWFRRHIKDELPEVARAEVERRDDLIAELRQRCIRMEQEDAQLRAMIRGAVGIMSGVTNVANTAAAERPKLRRAQ